MAKKITISFSVLFCMVLAGIVFSLVRAEYPTDTANASALLEQAQAYEAEDDYEQAESIYRSIITDYPGTDEAFQAQKNLALLFVVTLNYPAAQAEVETLIADFTEHPQLLAAVYDIANHYPEWQRHSHGEARGLYKYIVDNKPNGDLTFDARVWTIGSDFMLDNQTAAWEGIDALVKDFAAHPNLAKMIYDIAYNCWKVAKYKQAKQLYQYIVDKVPESDLAIPAQAWVAAAADIRLGNYATAQVKVDALIADFAEHPQLTGVIYQLADEYWYCRRYEESGRLYQSVLDRDSNGELAVWAKGWITGLELMLGNSLSAQQVIDVLVTDCAGQSQLVLGRILYGNANGCWYVGKYKEARELYKYIADNLPESNRFMRAKAWVAGADIMLGNYAAAQEKINAVIADFAQHPELDGAVYQLADVYWDVKRYDDGKRLYQYLLDNLPQSWYTPMAQVLIGNYYERLRYSGLIPESEANPKIEQAYQAVVEKYPYSPAVRDASIGLGWLNFKKGLWLQATQYWQLSLQRSPENNKPVHILCPLGRAYEEIGRLDKAVQLYNEFINSVSAIDPRIEEVRFRLETLALVR